MQVDALDVAHYLRSFPEAIYAANADYAFANGRLYDAHNGALMVILPFSTTIYALNPQGSDFWAYDAATNTIHHFANAAAVVTPGAVDFGGTSLNTTSLPVTVDVKNISPNPVTVTSVAAPAGFTIASNSCGALVGYASCAITLVASPTAQGAAAGSLVVYHSGGGPTSVSLSMLGERSMVSHYYQAALNRAPEPSGKSFWESEASRMVSLGADINEVWYVMATYFFNSAEYSSYNKTDTQFVTDLYNTFFNRAPDAGGLAFWVGQIGGGMPRQVVLSSFMFSPEFRTFSIGVFGNTAARPEVNMVMDMFRGILNRLPENTAYSFYVNQLRAAQCQGSSAVYKAVDDLSYAFIFGPEYANRSRSNAQFVGDLYNAFLRRGGELSGTQFWIDELSSGRRTRDQLRYAFMGSAEFNARVADIIGAGCLH
jgi:hypothetical protein